MVEIFEIISFLDCKWCYYSLVIVLNLGVSSLITAGISNLEAPLTAHSWHNDSVSRD